MKIKGADCSPAELEILQAADRAKSIASDGLLDAVALAKDVFGATITGYSRNGETFEPEPEPPIVLKKCVICGNPFNGAPESEYCGNEYAGEGHHRWIAEGRNPAPAQIKQLRRQCGHKIKAEKSEQFETWLRNFGKRIRRKPDEADEERPSIIRAIIDWHNAHPEMRLKSAKEQWQQWQRLEASMIYANRNQ
jgi:hypothetical protein